MGAAFDPAAARSEGRSISNDRYYLVTSPAPEAPLDLYGLHIKPQSHRIAVIFGSREFPGRAGCELAKRAFQERFTLAFGAPFVSLRIPDALQFGEHPRFAMLECKGEEAPFLIQITYADVELMMQFRGQRNAMQR